MRNIILVAIIFATKMFPSLYPQLNKKHEMMKVWTAKYVYSVFSSFDTTIPLSLHNLIWRTDLFTFIFVSSMP